MREQCPGQILVAGGAELASGHEHHVGEFRQRVDLLAVEQVGLDAFDAASRELFPQALFAEAGNAHDPLARRRALGELRQRRPDLSAHAEDDDVAGKVLERGTQGRRRRGHHLLQVLHVAEAIGQRGEVDHSRSCPRAVIGLLAR
jgi:hypothetical protein